MNIRIFKTYQKYSTHPYLCGHDATHGPLLCRLAENDEIQMWCVQCDYVLRPGLLMYKQLVQSVERLRPEWEKDNED